MSLPMPPPPAPTVQRCYRHPDREAGRHCTRCGRAACSDCLVTASIGSHCVACARQARPDVRTRARFWNAKQPTLVALGLMALNIAVFVYTSLADAGSLGGRGQLTQAQCDLGLSRQLLAQRMGCGAELYAPDGWYRLVSSGFLHFGIIHLAFNMLLLYQLGQLLEPTLGRVRFGLLYLASLLGGSLGVLLLDSGGLSGGASGAVFGLMAAAAIGMHRRGVNIFSTGIGTTLVLNLVLTFTIQGISIGGHLGGALAGAICGFVMLAPTWKRTPRWATLAAPAAVALVAVVGSVIVVG